MRVGHQDSTGKRWAFDIPCHPLQLNMITRFLRHLRNMGQTETQGLLLPTECYNERLSLGFDIEETVLTALSKRYPVQD